MATFVPYHTSAGQSTIVNFGGLLTTEFLGPPPGRCFLFRKTYKHDIKEPIPDNLRRLLDSPNRPKGPPLHFHQFQTEYFRVEAGLMGIKIDGVRKEVTVEDGEVSVKAGSIHQFFIHPDSAGDMTVYLSASDSGMGFQLDRILFENWYGYWHDALLFDGGLICSNTSRASMGTIPSTVGYWTCVILGRWIGGMLGYKPIFKEYTTDWAYAVAKVKGSFFQRHLVEDSFAAANSWPEQVKLSAGAKPTNAEYEQWTCQLQQEVGAGGTILTLEILDVSIVMVLATASESSEPVRALLLCAVLGGLVYGVYRILSIGKRERRLPPGPPTVPILGNEHQIPAADGHFLLTEWAHEFGGIFSLKRFTNTTLVISDRKLIKELLDKKSNIYSNRPDSVVARLITQGDHLLVMDYGETWRKIRKLVHQYFMEAMCEKQHIHVQHAEAIQMVRDFLVDPDNHMVHPKRYSNSITNSLVFGIRTKTIDSDYMDRLYELMEKWSLVMELGATPPVDSFPLLKYIPQRFLGYWRSRANDVGGLMKSLYKEVLLEVEQRRDRGINRDSFMDRMLDGQEKNQLSRNELYFLGGVLMEGGSDTSSSLILAILLAMMVYPQVQERAQAEIDAAIGDDKSPEWSDFSKLPYINMIIKESHRWRPVSPLGVPHALGQDSEVDGMFLPKGSTVVLNVWAMHHDEGTWKDPQHFIPERFESYPSLASSYAASGKWDERDHYGYGAGRRICPGIHLAERNLFIGVAKLLWAFKFGIKQGESINTSAETGLSQGFLHCVKEYGSSITLRSEAKRDTISREFDEAQTTFSKFE